MKEKQRPRKKSFMWTKSKIRKVIKLWDKRTPEDLAIEIGCDKTQVNYIAREARKVGFNLPKKHSRGQLRSLLEEIKNEKK